MITIRPRYLAISVALFAVEVAIARRAIPGAFVRNSVGDMLVIPLLYFFLRGVTKATSLVALVASLAMGLAAEILQYLQLADLLGLQHGGLLAIILGTTFSYTDLLMYGIGGILGAGLDVLVLQKWSAARPAP